MSVNWQGKTALVTGAGGFIGSHLTERLAHLGARTRALVHYNALGSAGWLDGSAARDEIEVLYGDIRDPGTLAEAVLGCDVVFHLAALIAIPYSYRAPLSYVRTNVEGTLNVMEACRTASVRRIVHTSTSEVYGTARSVPIHESHPLQGQSPYSASKIGADKIAESFQLSFGLPLVTVRPFNTFGPRQSARAVVPTVITQCLTSDVVRLGSTHPTRDLNFVSNTVDGFLAAADSPAAIGQVFNIGSGREISIGDLVHVIARIVGKSVRIETDAERVRPDQSEVERLVADNSCAGDVFGWTPAVSLEDGLRITINWFAEHLKKYRPGVYVT